MAEALSSANQVSNQTRIRIRCIGVNCDLATYTAGNPAGRKEHTTTFQVLVPIPGPNGAATTDVTLTVNRRDLNVGDLLARVRANMEVCKDVPLGWRLTNEAKNATRRLQTVEDAQLAVDTLLQKLDSPHRRNEVMLKIADCREKAKVRAIVRHLIDF
jgi:hypothetical protein